MTQQFHSLVESQEKLKHVSIQKLVANVQSNIFHNGQTLKQLKCPSIDEWVNECGLSTLWLRFSRSMDMVSLWRTDVLYMEQAQEYYA